MLPRSHSRHQNGRWAQIGWIELAYDWRATVVQYRYGLGENDMITVFRPPEPLGVFSYYDVTYSGGYFTFRYGSTTFGSELATFEPRFGQIFGETNTPANQMAGGYNSPEVFALSKKLPSQGGGWVAFNGLLDTTAPAYHWRYKQSSYQLHIWDNACAQ